MSARFSANIELSGFSKSIVAAVIGVLGRERAVLSIVVVCAILTYGGVSLFVVVFAVYPFAAEMFRQSGIPKRLMPATIALGAFTFTMDSLPGSPQIQNIIPTTFFKTTTWAAPWLGSDRRPFYSYNWPCLHRWSRRGCKQKAKVTGPNFATSLRRSKRRNCPTHGSLFCPGDGWRCKLGADRLPIPRVWDHT